MTTPEITSIRDADRVAGLLEANGVFKVKLLVNRCVRRAARESPAPHPLPSVRADMIKRNDMMSVRDVQEMLGIPLLGAIPEDTNVIVSTNRGEPLVLKKKLTLAGVAYENAARRLTGRKDELIDLERPELSLGERLKGFFGGGKQDA